MSGDPLQSMKAAHEVLAAALESNDVAAIEAAVASFGASVDRLGAAAPGLKGEDVAARAAELRRLAEESQMRVNFLTDVNRRRLERFAALGGQARPSRYGREGR